LRDGLRMIESCGLKVQPGRIFARKVRRQDWSESWKKYFKTVEIGRALMIKPSWSKQRPRKGQAVVVLDPGLSFGTGQHPTTLFCLQQLVGARTPGRPQSLLDIGTGSGILAIAAAKLGYTPVQAFDFDSVAVAVAARNAIRNGVQEAVVIRRRDLTKLAVQSNTKYQVICANLADDLLIAEGDKILNRLDSKGRLILAGILKTQFAGVRTTFENRGLSLVASRTEGEWQSGAFLRG